MAHDHSHHAGRSHGHHHHAPGQPHPAQTANWSILRMPLAARLGITAALSAGLWAIVLIAMR